MSTSITRTTTPYMPSWLFLLGVLTALAPLSIDMYLPGFPAIEKSLIAQTGSAELTLASYFIGLAIGQLFYGPLSDRFGRKKPLMVGLLIYVLASIGCALATDITSLIIWRFMQALGGCAGIVITMAIVRDRCDANESARSLSMLMLVMGLAPILAPMLGGWVVAFFSWRALFMILGTAGLLGFLAVFLWLEESHDTRNATPLKLSQVLSDYGRLLLDRKFIGYTLSGGLARAGMFAYIAGSPFVLIEIYDIPAQHYGWVFGANAAGLIAMSQINAWHLKHASVTTLLRKALWLPAICGIALFTLTLTSHMTLPLLMIGIFGFVASLGYISPNSSASALATHGQQAGMASALMGSLQFGFATIAGFMVNRLHDGTVLPLTLLMAICGFGAWLSHRWLIKT